MKAFQWNPPVTNEEGRVVLQDHMSGYVGHPHVRFTSFDEIWEVLKTPGNSHNEPYWSWQVLGILESDRGKQVVCPGDWIVELIPDYFVILTEKEYQEFRSRYE